MMLPHAQSYSAPGMRPMMMSGTNQGYPGGAQSAQSFATGMANDPLGQRTLLVTGGTSAQPVGQQSFADLGAAGYGQLAPNQNQPSFMDVGAGGYHKDMSHWFNNGQNHYGFVANPSGSGNNYTPAPREVPVQVQKPPEKPKECAEEECLDQDQCGNETHGPKKEQQICGYDTRPLLPFGFWVSTMIGAAVMMLVQVPIISGLIGISESVFKTFFFLLYGTTLGCMLWCAISDPGQISEEEEEARRASEGSLIQSESFSSTAEEQKEQRHLPKRSRKTWQYPRPVLRYDHYCRWLMNTIGLRNHREFVTMLVGLCSIGVFGLCVDALLLIVTFTKYHAFDWRDFVVVLHLGYSGIMLGLVAPIFRIHFGLVSRNETAHEWKSNNNYVARKSKKGDNVPMNELSEDEFNEQFESMEYEMRRNQWDRGFIKNCYAFWLTPRYTPDQKGEF